MKITRYVIKNKKKIQLHIALVADLHDRNPEDAIRTLTKLKPDLILVAGDTMERHEPSKSIWNIDSMDAWQGIAPWKTNLHKLIKRLDGSYYSESTGPVRWNRRNGYRFLMQISRIAPTILSVGNHEWYFEEQDLKLMKQCGIVLLDNEDTTININGQTLRIGGLSTRYNLDWLKAFGQKDGMKILLSHHPAYYHRFIYKKSWDTFDLVLSGHTHGGQWRFFSDNGKKRGMSVFSPDQGVFPTRAYGQFGKLIITSGIANTAHKIPRFGNPCEVVSIRLTP